MRKKEGGAGGSGRKRDRGEEPSLGAIYQPHVQCVYRQVLHVV